MKSFKVGDRVTVHPYDGMLYGYGDNMGELVGKIFVIHTARIHSYLGEYVYSLKGADYVWGNDALKPYIIPNQIGGKLI